MTENQKQTNDLPEWCEGLDFEGWEKDNPLITCRVQRSSEPYAFFLWEDGDLIVEAPDQEEITFCCQTPAAALELANHIARLTGGWK